MDLKIKDVADLLNVSEATIHRWIGDGSIPNYRIKQDHFFSRTEIQNWMISFQPIRYDESPSQPLVNHKEKELSTLEAPRIPSRGGSKQFCLFRAIHKGAVLHHIKGQTKEEVIRTTMQKTAKSLHLDADIMTDLLLDRENLMTTALSNGIAIPHTRDSLLNAQHDAVIVVFLDKPLEYGALDGKPIHTLFFLFACEDKRHLHLLAKIAHLSSQESARNFFLQQPTKEQLLAYIKGWESQMRSL